MEEEEIEAGPGLALLSAQEEEKNRNLLGELGCRTGHGDRVRERGKEQGCGMAFGDESTVMHGRFELHFGDQNSEKQHHEYPEHLVLINIECIFY